MSGPGSSTPTRVRVLPESWAARVSDFVRGAGTAEEAAAEGVPEMLFSRVYLPTHMSFYSDFNIRSRHFRCQETFFVDTDEAGGLRAVVSLDGLRTKRRVANVNLIVARPPAGDPAPYVASLLDDVLRVAGEYSAAAMLRLSYVYDTSFEAPLGVRISSLFLDPPASLPLREQARVANETGKNREVVLLAFSGLRGAAAEERTREQP